MKRHKRQELAAPLMPLACLILLTFTACVHEHPQEGAEIDPTHIELTLELSTDPSITTASVFSKSTDEAPYVYFVVELFEGDFGTEPVLREETCVPREADGSASIILTELLNAGTYRLAAFASCVKDEHGNGSAYDFSDLGNIRFANEEYVGATDLKECYDLRMEIDLPYEDWFAKDTVTATLESPVGRVEVISEDAADFITKTFNQEGGMGTKADNEEFWQAYGARWDYALYFPTRYDVYTGVPIDSELGIRFTSDVIQLTDTEVLMGYDYAFVNGDATKVNITVSLTDRQTGEILNSYSGLSAEIHKGRTTVIRGEFLTASQGSGIGIDPEFDGDIDIVLPD